MSVFPTSYPHKTDPVGDDKLLIADSEDGDCIAYSTIDEVVKSIDGGILSSTTYYTANNTYSKPANLKFIRVRLVGGGGAGGGANATAAAQFACGGGGGGGGYAESIILASSLSASESITVGAGGTAVSGGTGGSGGTSSFGSLVSASGGNGAAASGAQSGSFISTLGASGGTTNVGDITINGSRGGGVIIISGTQGMPGYGGASQLGPNTGAPATNSVGSQGALYGGGGSGARNSASQSARAGGGGAAGIVIIEEYI